MPYFLHKVIAALFPSLQLSIDRDMQDFYKYKYSVIVDPPILVAFQVI